MRRETKEWVAKAEADFDAAQALFRRRKFVHHDTVCFHAQQCAEKYLKARLVEARFPYPKTHALSPLLHLLAPVEPLWASYEPLMDCLTQYAVAFRYPGDTATRQEAREALAACRELRKAVRLSLGLP
ncbi:MAG: HEPN domain-containing protein [Candidatus Sumerlaeota bacterium]|nr:HEPN domain-containing protein [Candidatus Sumerlaeota bacterium]